MDHDDFPLLDIIDRPADRYSVNPGGYPWVPAFAGMTLGARQGDAGLPGTGVGHAGPGFGRRQRTTGLEQLDGNAVRRADEGHATVSRRAVDGYAAGDEGVAGVVDVVDGVGEMAEIAAAGVRLGIPVVREFHGSRFVAGCGEEDVGVAALLVGTAADLAQAEHLEEGDGVLERTDADHGVQVFRHGVSSVRGGGL